MIKIDTGIGLRHKHIKELLEKKPDVSWLEVHAENFFKSELPVCSLLDKVAEHYPLSAHCVGLSLGSELNETHIKSLKEFIKRYQPVFVSDHLSWSWSGDIFISDLLPIPYTEESLEHFCNNVSKVQDIIGRQILVENPSSYISFKSSNIGEAEFLANISKKTGCGILLDLNNIYVSSSNQGFDIDKYLEQIPRESVKEIHLAGYSEKVLEYTRLYIDDHSTSVNNAVWELYQKSMQYFGVVPTLAEWDTDLPDLVLLTLQADKAKYYMNNYINSINAKA